jgi:hypothetical protein
MISALVGVKCTAKCYSSLNHMRYFLLAALHLQKSPAGSMLPQHSTSWIQPLSTQSQLCQQKIRLQSLQMERERLKLRQQEIMRQVCCLVVVVVVYVCLTTWVRVLLVKLLVEVEVNLRPTVSWPVRLGIGPPYGTLDQILSCSSFFCWQLLDYSS